MCSTLGSPQLWMRSGLRELALTLALAQRPFNVAVVETCRKWAELASGRRGHGLADLPYQAASLGEIGTPGLKSFERPQKRRRTGRHSGRGLFGGSIKDSRKLKHSVANGFGGLNLDSKSAHV